MEENLINIPAKVHCILNKLNANGHKAYVVGGCVRDCLLGKKPKDWDITTSATPDQIKKLFYKTIDTGIKHGTVTVLMEGEPYEVTTFRIDGIYEDHRRPSEVQFTMNVEEDLKRRDFTMNAMAYHPKEGVIDPFGGREDMKREIICSVGDPEERFDEDALRMLRAIRFSARFNFPIDTGTKAAILKKSSLIQNVSVERIREELNKILISDYPERILMLHDLGLMHYILPEFEPCIGTEQNHPYHTYAVHEHIMKSMRSIEPKVSLRWTMFLHDIGKGYTKTTDEKGIDHFYGHVEKSVELAKEILTRLKFDNKTSHKVLQLVQFHDYRLRPAHKIIRRALGKMGKEIFIELLKVQEADIKAQHPRLVEERLQQLKQIREIYNDIIEKDQCFQIRHLAIGGNDLLALGIPKGKQIGEILEALLDYVLEEPEKNTREDLVLQVKRFQKS